MKKVLNTALKLTAAAAVVAGATAANAAVDFGKRGEKVDLVIGYQPYYTESWTGVVNNGKGFGKTICQPDLLLNFKWVYKVLLL